MIRLAAALLLALLVRLVFFGVWEAPIQADAADYVRIARDVAQGLGFRDILGEPTSFRPPGYPAFLAGLMVLGGGHWLDWARLAQIGLDLASVALVFRIAADAVAPVFEAPWRWRVAPIAAVLFAVSLGAAAATQRVLSETLFTTLLLATVATSIRWSLAERDAARLQWAVATGVLAGLGALTRGVWLAYPPVLVVAAWWAERRFSRSSLALLAAFALTLGPWSVRNYAVHEAVVPVSTQVGITLYASVHPPDGVFGMLPRDSLVLAAEALPEAERSSLLARAAVRDALSDPARTLSLTVKKAAYFLVPLDWEILPHSGSVNPWWLFVCGLLGVGLLLPASRGAMGQAWPVWLPFLFLFGMALVFYGSPRLRLPAEPCMAALGGAAIVAILARWGRGGAVLLGVLIAVAISTAVGWDTLEPWLLGPKGSG